MIFFDIDETLLNQRRAEWYAAHSFVEAFGRHLPSQSIEEFCTSWRTLREKHARAFLTGVIGHQEQRRRRIRELFVAPSLDDDEADARYAAFLESYRRHWSLFDDVLPCLDSLNDERLGIISNGSTGLQLDKLKCAGVLHRFEVIVISEEVGVAKPDPDIFLHACRCAGRRPEDCIYIGDRLDEDARSSQTVGMRGIWLARGLANDAVDGLTTIRSLAEFAKPCARSNLPRSRVSAQSCDWRFTNSVGRAGTGS